MVVSTIYPESSAPLIPLKLPSQTRAYIEAPIFAQTTGYLKKWYFDIGAKVKAGEILAEIDTPQVDEQYNQARAQLKVAEAALAPGSVSWRSAAPLSVATVRDAILALDSFTSSLAASA